MTDPSLEGEAYFIPVSRIKAFLEFASGGAGHNPYPLLLVKDCGEKILVIIDKTKCYWGNGDKMLREFEEAE